MKQVFNFRLLAVLAIIVFSSCSKKDNPIIPLPSPPSGKPKPLVPLAVGNSWTFRVTTFDTTGPVVWVDTLRFFIRADTFVNNMRWYLEGYDGVMPGPMGFRHDQAGFHETNFVGNSWDYKYPAQPGQYSGIYVVESIDSVLTTPLGDLHCYVYKYNWYGQSGRMIFAPGIGWIRTEVIGRTWGGTVWLAQTQDLVAAVIDSTSYSGLSPGFDTRAFPAMSTGRLLRKTRPTMALPYIEKE
jgi:hypothetical protein